MSYERTFYVDFDLPLKIQFLKSVKINVESSLIAHSIGNFILKNNIIGHILIKQTLKQVRRYDVMGLIYDVT